MEAVSSLPAHAPRRARRAVVALALLLAACDSRALGVGTTPDGGAAQPDAGAPLPDAAPDTQLLAPDSAFALPLLDGPTADAPVAAPDTADAPVAPDAVPDAVTDAVTDAGDATAGDAPRCGDGRLDPGETCDDGNARDDDGCSARCQIEGWPDPCRSPVCPPVVRCGDGRVGPGEACDDGNTVRGDGCSDACLVEPGHVCAVPGFPCRTVCGDGVVTPDEACDLGAGNEVNPYGEGKCTTACKRAPFCGDGIVQPAFGEDCEGDGTRLCFNCRQGYI